MEKVIGVALGLVAFTAVCVVGLIGRASVQDTLLKAIFALLIGFIAGWIIFGNFGIGVLKGNLIKREEEK